MSLLGQSILGDHREEDNFLAEPNLLKRSFASFKPTAQPNDWNESDFLQEDIAENYLIPEFELVTSTSTEHVPFD